MNVDLLARIQCQQKIVNGQIQTVGLVLKDTRLQSNSTNSLKVFNLLVQRDNKLNITVAAASQRDNTAMKTISIVTMVFLPGTYIAVSGKPHFDYSEANPAMIGS
jgi:hypothetical protein